jgi:hypothetical protein
VAASPRTRQRRQRGCRVDFVLAAFAILLAPGRPGWAGWQHRRPRADARACALTAEGASLNDRIKNSSSNRKMSYLGCDPGRHLRARSVKVAGPSCRTTRCGARGCRPRGRTVQQKAPTTLINVIDRSEAGSAHGQQRLQGHRSSQLPLAQPTALRRSEQPCWNRSRPRVLPGMRPRIATLDRIGLTAARWTGRLTGRPTPAFTREVVL